MSKREGIASWLWIRCASGEELYWVRQKGCRGKISLSRLPEGIPYFQQADGRFHLFLPKGIEGRVFSDQEVLVRLWSQGSPRRAWMNRHLEIFGAVGILMLGPAFFYAVFSSQNHSVRKIQPPRETRLTVARSLPKPSPVPEIVGEKKPKNMRKTVPRPIATPKAVSKKRRPRKKVDRPLERKLRKAFLRGELDRSLALMAQLRSNQTSPHSQTLRAFFAEVSYAACRRSVANKKWALAVSHCEQALADYASHKLAKQVLRALGAKARKLFLEGYVMESTHPQAALERYREAVVVSPTRSPFGRKAAEKLKSIKDLSVH